jgi:hypothetical protein
VVVEETKAPEVTEEEELADPVVVESEETYLKEFDANGSLKDTAMKEAGDDWIRMSTEKQKTYEKTKFVGDQSH